MEFSSFFGWTRQPVSINMMLRTQLLWMLLLRVVLYTLLLSVSYFLQGAAVEVFLLPPELFFLLLLAVYLTSIFSGLYLIGSSTNLRRFGFIQCILDAFFVTILVYFTGSSRSIFTIVYFFPIIAGGLVMPRKGGLVAASSSTILYAALLFAEYKGFSHGFLSKNFETTHPNPAILLNHFAIHGLIFFLAAVLSALFGLRLHRAENALYDSQRDFDRLAVLYKQIFDNISTGILTIDQAKTITSANNAIGKITGLQHWLLLGRNLEEVIPDLELNSENVRLTADFSKEDGTKVRIGYAHMNIEDDADQATAFGPSKIITLQDISEIERLERQVRQSEKLAAIGMMSASIAHDFRNPLAAISGSAQVLAADLSKGSLQDQTNAELAGIIIRESNRLIQTIGEFLRFSRPEHAHCKWFSLRGCLLEVLQVGKADPNWPHTAEITLDLTGHIDIWADEKQMFTVFNHLIHNALAFCPKGQENIAIKCHEQTGQNGEETLEITIGDNGPGIEENKRELVFEPFYTSRPDGTGLGLAIVRQTLEEHHGTISIEDNEGGGALFHIVMPMPPA